MKTSMVGICHTDIELFNGYYHFEGIAGHEFVGIVDRAPHQDTFVGQRVMVDINCGCGRCMHCLSSDARLCPDRTILGILGRDGAFAEYVKVPLRNVHIIDESIDTEDAVFTEPLAAVLEIMQQIHIKNQSRIAVLGDGKRCFDIVVEATGRIDGINLAIDLTRPEGMLVIKTTTEKLSKIDLAKIVVKELHMIESRCGDLDLAPFSSK